MKLLGLNVDLDRRDADPLRLEALGCGAIRWPVKVLHRLTPALDFRRRGMALVPVITRTWVDEFPTFRAAADEFATVWGGIADYVQVGNEPDQVSPSSWTMDESASAYLVRAFRDALQDDGWPGRLIGPGLASGNGRWAEMSSRSADAVGLHPYGEGVAIAAFLERYRWWSLPLWITEWWPNEQATRLALEQPDVEAVFWWWHQPDSADLAIKDRLDRHAAFARLAQQYTQRGPQMPTTDERLAELEKQQSLQTEAIKRMLEGKFKGGVESAEAIAYALNPGFLGKLQAVDFPKE